MNLKSHLQAMSDLHTAIDDIRKLADELPDCTEKGRLLANVDAMQETAEYYTDDTIELYEKIMGFAMRAAV
jgi:hypothetical protein